MIDDYDFLEEQTILNKNILKSMISATPETWNRIRLIVEYTGTEGGYDNLNFLFESPDGHSEIIVPTEEVYDSVTKLFNTNSMNGKRWRKLICLSFIDTDSKWKMECDYEYDNKKVP